MASRSARRRVSGAQEHLLLLALTLGIAPAATAAQDPTPPLTFGASVAVHVVEIEVFVSDGRGEPVIGLVPSDFVLEVDGEPREILNFYEARPLAEPPLEATAAHSTGPPAAVLEPLVQSPPLGQQFSLVVLLDDLHLQPHSRKRTLDRLTGLLEARLAAGDQVMLTTLDRSLRVRRAFDATSPLAADLEALQRRAPGGVNAELERRQALAQIRDFYADRGCQALPEMQAIRDGWAAVVDRESRGTLAALQTLLESLAGRSGRKALLVVTEGLTLNPGLEATLLLEALCPGNRMGATTGLVAALAKVTRAANAAQVTIYALDAGGQRVLGSAVDNGPGLGLADQAAVRADLQNSAFALAADTGGKALLESNHPELLLAGLAQDFEARYSLGFSPAPGDDRRSHRLSVKVRRAGVRVRHRAAWQSLPPEEQLAARLLAALRYGGESANPLHARIEAGAPRREPDGSFTLVLRLTVPAANIVLLPQQQRRRGSLRVLLAVQDGEGGTTKVRALPLPVDLAMPATGGTADGATVPLELRLRLRPGHNSIGVAVHDELGLQTSVLRTEATVG